MFSYVLKRILDFLVFIGKRNEILLKKSLALLVLLAFVTGCASSSDLEKSAQLHAKTGDYYESIGQPGAAKEENNATYKDRDQATGFIAIFVDLFEHISNN